MTASRRVGRHATLGRVRHLWVRLSHPGDSLTHLRAIASDGRALGVVRLPEDMRIFEVGRDYVLGAFEEEGGEPHVAMFAYRRGG